MQHSNKTMQQRVNFGGITKETIKKHNSNWQQISDHLYRYLINGGCGSANTNPLF